jgi:hypothetical protein
MTPQTMSGRGVFTVETIGLQWRGGDVASLVEQFVREQASTDKNYYINAGDDCASDVAKFKQFTNVQFSV